MTAKSTHKAIEETKERTFKGIGVSPGICIGKAYRVDTGGVEVVKKYQIEDDGLVEEANRFKTAVRKAGDELQALIDSSRNKFNGHTPILETHQVLLKDKMLYRRTLDTIEKEKINAEWALRKVTGILKSMFQELDDPYLRERAVDVEQVSERILRNLVGVDAINISEIDRRVILVAEELSPAETSEINLERIKGFITDRGGMTSHTGIIARTLEIPTVLGMGNITRHIENDDLIIVDGLQGLVIVHPREQTILKYEERGYQYEQFKAEIIRDSFCEAQTVDGIDIKIMGNIELPEEVVTVRDHGGDGIGLYRTEFQYMNRLKAPSEDELFEKYRDVVEVMAGKPVTIRTLDINGDKAMSGNPESTEPNPAMGLRGIRFCLQRPDIFTSQLRAILRAAAYGEVRLLLPMISNCAEIKETRRLLAEAADALKIEGTPFNLDIKIGIMVEVPATVIMADVIAEHVDFFSIGTNDLIQYTLAVDRGNPEVAHLYHPLHPAVLRMLERVTKVAAEKKIEVYMCGEMAGDLVYVPILLGLGLNELSMSPQAIPMVKCFIRTLNLEEAREFLQDILSVHSAGEIRQMVYHRYGDRMARMMAEPPLTQQTRETQSI
ncbi:MAG: phosphoenolpyruvate--protein phosphotransferase [Deltaproteobacteria bacterium]|nr:MAG: phosphoenolpyruvate--protein phosphotransferase [Deltaproteobacteria bacterium]